MILANVKTPNVYTDININTQRTGLLPNHQRVLFITGDSLGFHEIVEHEQLPVDFHTDRVDEMDHIIPKLPVPLDSVEDIYDTQSADKIFGKNSVVGRMMKAAVKTNRLVNVQAISGYRYFEEEQMIAK